MVETKEMEPLLLVEDKPELRAMLRKALERAGYAVTKRRTAQRQFRRSAREGICW